MILTLMLDSAIGVGVNASGNAQDPTFSGSRQCMNIIGRLDYESDREAMLDALYSTIGPCALLVQAAKLKGWLD